jgi:hypothetical protein
MPKMTVHIPDEDLERFRKTCPDVNIGEVMRQGIIKKLAELKKFEELKRKGVI